jgi:hypothetical protein
MMMMLVAVALVLDSIQSMDALILDPVQFYPLDHVSITINYYDK